ncbi:putative dimethylallyl tryptophan synthase [Aspergillus karnatakaensis]|uniref:putative dimethylallyl tryptophan synthase n=1 Tax=Aspergillus karnatakaensis TaxID=1810916 RepID=UPI003CCDB26E
MTDEKRAVPRTYEAVTKSVLFPNLEEKEWWEATGPMFSKMLEDAHYDKHHQFQNLYFYVAHVIPYLGPFPKSRPNLYKCALGGLGSLELSQNFTKNRATVRMTFEPTSYAASTGDDVCNRGTTDEALRRLKRVFPKIDLSLYHELVSKLTLTDVDERTLLDRGMLADLAVKTQAMVALDLKGDDIAAKLYLIPPLKSLATGTPVWKLIRDAVRAADTGSVFSEGLSNVEAFLQNGSSTRHPDMLSCDLVSPSETRFKIYVSEFHVSFESVTSIWTLDGKIQGTEMEEGLQILKGIWDALEIPTGVRPPPDPAKPTPTLPPHELPIVVNMEIRPNSPLPQPKLYFPLPGRNNLAVATTIEKVFRSWGWEDHASSFISNLAGYKPGVDLSESLDLFSWLSFSYTSKTGPYVTMYYH